MTSRTGQLVALCVAAAATAIICYVLGASTWETIVVIVVAVAAATASFSIGFADGWRTNRTASQPFADLADQISRFDDRVRAAAKIPVTAFTDDDSGGVPRAALEAITVLNRALATDPACIDTLMRVEVACNRDLGDDPTIQVGPTLLRAGTVTGEVLRPLGLINGLFGARSGDQYGYIAMDIDDATGRVIEFIATPPPAQSDA